MNPAEDYILGQEEPFRTILLQLQSLIEGLVPGVSLKYKYRIPFYYLDGKPFCYLNQSGEYVDLGFYRAAWLTKHLDKMESRGRKVMKSLRYHHPEEVDLEILKTVLEEARKVQQKSSYKPG
jgi:hypothetical protein